MQRFATLFSTALFSVGLTVGMTSATVYAQDAAAPTGAEAAAAAQNFSDAELQKFADASRQIAEISQDYTARLQDAEGQEAQQEVRVEANEKMIEAVHDSGLDVETFNAIGQAIQQDPELMKRVQEMAQP